LLDRRISTQAFQEGFDMATFDAANPVNCRYIRLVQTGPNHGDDSHCLCLAGVEFFGTLFEADYQ
jgi:hypothetical protein